MGWFLDVLAEYIFRITARGIYLLRSYNWIVIKATVLGVDCPDASFGCTVATINYEYTASGVRFAGCYRKPFLVHASGVAYSEQFVKRSGL
jgi:hypothetical protein